MDRSLISSMHAALKTLGSPQDKILELDAVSDDIDKIQQSLSGIRGRIASTKDHLNGVIFLLNAVSTFENEGIPNSQNELLSVADLEKEFRLSRQTIYRWRRSGDFPPHIAVGRRAMWSKGDIAKWLSHRKRV